MENYYLSDSIMLEMLAKVASLQIEIIKSGRSCHLDAGAYDSFLDTGKHISFDVTVYEDHCIVRSFEFSSTMSQDELEAEFMCIQAYVNRIKKELL